MLNVYLLTLLSYVHEGFFSCFCIELVDSNREYSQICTIWLFFLCEDYPIPTSGLFLLDVLYRSNELLISSNLFLCCTVPPPFEIMGELTPSNMFHCNPIIMFMSHDRTLQLSNCHWFMCLSYFCFHITIDLL